MVNRIDNNNPYEYSRTKNVNPGSRIEEGEKFRLDYGNGTNLSREEQKEKIDKTASGNTRNSDADREGVRLELSGQGQEALRRVKSPGRDTEGTDTKQPSALESLRGMVRTVMDAVKAILHRIWYDAPKEAESGIGIEQSAAALETEPEQIEKLKNEENGETAKEADSPFQEHPPTAEELTFQMRSEEVRIDREVQPYLKSGDLSHVLSLLTDNGRKTVAHNSTLLTYYDRNGNVVEPSASDRERILHGDRNAKQL